MTDGEIVRILLETIKDKWEMHPDASVLSQMKSNDMLKIGG